MLSGVTTTFHLFGQNVFSGNRRFQPKFESLVHSTKCLIAITFWKYTFCSGLSHNASSTWPRICNTSQSPPRGPCLLYSTIYFSVWDPQMCFQDIHEFSVKLYGHVCVCICALDMHFSWGRTHSFHQILGRVSDPKTIRRTQKHCFKRNFHFCQIGQIST